MYVRDKLCVCPICNERYTQWPSLALHRTIHSEEKEHACSVNSEKFAQSQNLSQCVIVCSICDKQLVGIESLIQHMKIHTGEKPSLIRHYIDATQWLRGLTDLSVTLLSLGSFYWK